MSNGYVIVFRGLVDSIKPVNKPDEIWEILPSMETQYGYPQADMQLFRQQVKYNIIHHAGWETVSKRAEEFILKLEQLTELDIAEDMDISMSIATCYGELKDYTDMLSQSLAHADLLVTELFTSIQPMGIDGLTTNIVEPATVATKLAGGVPKSEEFEGAFAAALANSGLSQRALQAASSKFNKIMGVAKQEAARNVAGQKRHDRPDPSRLPGILEGMHKAAQKMQNLILRAVASVEGKLAELWNKDDIHARYKSNVSWKGFEMATSDLYTLIMAKATAGAKDLWGEERKVPVTEQNAVALLNVVMHARRRVSKMENSFYIKLAWWLSLCCLIAGGTAFTVWALELNIALYKLGIALGLVLLSVVGFFVHSARQRAQLRKMFPEEASNDPNNVREVADPTADMAMRPLGGDHFVVEPEGVGPGLPWGS